MDIIKLDVPLFVRLLELAREEIKNDADLHDIAEAVTKLSQRGVVTMDDYPVIVKQMTAIGQTKPVKQSDPLASFKAGLAGKPPAQVGEANDPGEYDQEGDMAQQDLRTAADAAEELRSILHSNENLPEWVQAKITKAVDYLDTARDYMKSKDQPVDELDRIKQLGGMK